MNDDEKKPGNVEGGVGTPNDIDGAEDVMIDVKVGSKDSVDSKGSDEDASDAFDTPDNKVEDELDIAAAFSSKDGAAEEEPDEELTDLDKELGRIEGVESVEAFGKKATENDSLESEDITDEPGDDEPLKSIDLDPATPDLTKENELVAAMRQREKIEKTKKSKTKLVIVLLGVLFVAALGGAVYFYMQTTALAGEKSAIEAERADLSAQNAALKVKQAQSKEDALKEAREELANAAGDDENGAGVQQGEYVTIEELGVRYKKTDATKNLIYGYTVTSDSPDADAVAFSTTALARLVVRNGASATYPCAFTGNVPTITRYKQDVAIGDSTASKVGKQLGSAYYVYTAPIGACINTNAEDLAARNAAVQAVYDSLEAVPAQAVSTTN